jgi:hypothetical protein
VALEVTLSDSDVTAVLHTQNDVTDLIGRHYTLMVHPLDLINTSVDYVNF